MTTLALVEAPETGPSQFDFDGQAVRVITIDGEPWFVAADVTALLGYAGGSRNAIASLPERMRSSVALANGTPGNPNRAVLNEAGVNRLIMRSTLPDAERIQDWLAEEVLPSIRKTGQYGTAPALTGPELLARAVIEAQQMIEVLGGRIVELEPKAAYVDTFVALDDLRPIRHVANSLDIAENQLRALLLQSNWIYAEHSSRFSEREGRTVKVTRYSAYAGHREHFRAVPVHEAPRFKGEVMHTLKVTPTGANAIARLLARTAS